MHWFGFSALALLAVLAVGRASCLCDAPVELELDALLAACPLVPQCAALGSGPALVVLAGRHLDGWPNASNHLCVGNATCGDADLLARTGALILAADEAAARTCSSNEVVHVPDPVNAPGVYRCVCAFGRRCAPTQPRIWIFLGFVIVLAGFIISLGGSLLSVSTNTKRA